MKSDFFISPDALVRARLDQLLSQPQLASKSGVSLRSIQGYESREQRVRLETLTCLATALSVDVKDIASIRSASTKSASGKSAPPAPIASSLPPRTALETLVDLERDAGIDAVPVKTSRGPAETLTAKRLQDVFTAYALHEGARFTLSGKVDGMRGLPPAEAKLLGSRSGIAARFHIVKEIVPGHPVGVTVHSAGKAETVRLQERYKQHATVHMRVVLVPGEPSDDGPGFSSFITRITAKRPWAFVVEEVFAAEATSAKRVARAKRAK